MKTKIKIMITSLLLMMLLKLSGCKDGDNTQPVTPVDTKLTYYGADLSYANQIIDHGGVFKDNGLVTSPYKIFKDHGTNLVRFRLWHNPAWTKELYGASGTQLYNDLIDVEKSIKLSKEQGLKVLLDFHYSDTWTDPSKQDVPAAWADITDIAVLKDSVYNYTFKVLTYLNNKGLMPELVQIGNETNCGLVYSNAKDGFPTCNVCNGQWTQIGGVINKAIDAVHAVSANSSIKTKIILHVADPKNVTWWFDNITSKAAVTDFDIVGFSYYPIWHTTVSISDLSTNVAAFKSKYGKDVMILETAFPWTPDGDDSYNNQFGGTSPFADYPFTQTGQFNLMKKLVQEMKDGGGIGVISWEPDWISSQMKDSWGTGSSFENCAFFDFDGNPTKAMDFAK